MEVEEGGDFSITYYFEPGCNVVEIDYPQGNYSLYGSKDYFNDGATIYVTRIYSDIFINVRSISNEMPDYSYLPIGYYLFKKHSQLTDAPNSSIYSGTFVNYTLNNSGRLDRDYEADNISGYGGKTEVYAALPESQRTDWVQVPAILFGNSYPGSNLAFQSGNHFTAGIAVENALRLTPELYDWIQENTTYYSSKPSNWQ